MDECAGLLVRLAEELQHSAGVNSKSSCQDFVGCWEFLMSGHGGDDDDAAGLGLGWYLAVCYQVSCSCIKCILLRAMIVGTY